jgi:hypothetical protein
MVETKLEPSRVVPSSRATRTASPSARSTFVRPVPSRMVTPAATAASAIDSTIWPKPRRG